MTVKQENIPVPGREYFIRPVQSDGAENSLNPGRYKIRQIGIQSSTGFIYFLTEDSEQQHLVRDYLLEPL